MKKNTKPQNPLEFSEKDIYGDSIISPESSNTDDNENADLIDVFDYENLVLEYNFKTGSSSLYLQTDENHYELLYETVIENGIENSTLYSKDSAYILTGYDQNTGNIFSLDYLSKSNFINLVSKYGEEPPTKLGKIISTYSCINFMYKNSKRLISENVYYDNFYDPYIFDNYKKLFIKYTSSTKLIPSYFVIEGLISDIHNYIATQKFDKTIFEKRLSELQNFKDICPNSTSILASFIENPTQTDLQQVCDSLGKSLKNMDKLLNIYLSEELSLQEKGEKYDCK